MENLIKILNIISAATDIDYKFMGDDECKILVLKTREHVRVYKVNVVGVNNDGLIAVISDLIELIIESFEYQDDNLEHFKEIKY